MEVCIILTDIVLISVSADFFKYRYRNIAIDNQFYDVFTNVSSNCLWASRTNIPCEGWKTAAAVKVQANVKKRKGAKKLVVLVVNQIAGKQPKRRALFLCSRWQIHQRFSHALALPRRVSPFCSAANGEKKRTNNTSSRLDMRFPRGFASPLGCAAMQMALSTAAVSAALLFNHRVQLKWTHTLSRVLTPLRRLSIRGKTREGWKKKKFIDATQFFSAIWSSKRRLRDTSARNIHGFHYWRPLLCLNHNSGDSGCQWEPRWHADGGEEGRLELGHGGGNPGDSPPAKANILLAALMS